MNRKTFSCLYVFVALPSGAVVEPESTPFACPLAKPPVLLRVVRCDMATNKSSLSLSLTVTCSSYFATDAPCLMAPSNSNEAASVIASSGEYRSWSFRIVRTKGGDSGGFEQVRVAVLGGSSNNDVDEKY